MINNDIKKLDNLFFSYNYSLSKNSTSKIRIYTLTYGMYNAAEIVLIDESYDYESIKSEFSKLGYATEVKYYKNIEIFEEYLFEGFFVKPPLGNELSKRYNQFVNNQRR